MFNDETLRLIHLSLYYKEQGESRAEIGRILGVTSSLVKTRLAQVKAALINRQLPHTDLQKDYPLEAFELRQEAKEAQVTQDMNREANTVARTTIRNEYVQDQLLEAIKGLLPPRTNKSEGKSQKTTNGQKQTDNSTVWITISDVHVGKRSESFSHEDALECITKMIQAGLDEAKERNAKELVIALLGDILDGYGIYRSQVAEVSLTATEQFTETLQCLGDAFESVLSGFDGDVKVIGIPGNHGRVSTPEVASWENFERLLYNTLEIWFRDESRIKFHVPTRENFYVIYRNIFLFHGHEISGNGTLDGIIQRVRQWLTMLNEDWKVSVCGHFHRLMMAHYPQNRIHLTNGTATKGDTFIQRLGATHANQWWMFIQNDDNDVTEYIPVSLYD